MQTYIIVLRSNSCWERATFYHCHCHLPLLPLRTLVKNWSFCRFWQARLTFSGIRFRPTQSGLRKEPGKMRLFNSTILICCIELKFIKFKCINWINSSDLLYDIVLSTCLEISAKDLHERSQQWSYFYTRDQRPVYSEIKYSLKRKCLSVIDCRNAVAKNSEIHHEQSPTYCIIENNSSIKNLQHASSTNAHHKNLPSLLLIFHNGIVSSCRRRVQQLTVLRDVN